MWKIIKCLLIIAGVGLVLLLAGAAPPLLYFLSGCNASSPPYTQTAAEQGSLPSDITAVKEKLSPYARDEESTFLTFPEWYIVYSADEYGSFLKENRPSQFPYFQSIAQYWQTYGCVHEVTREQYPFNSGRHLTLMVIGTSFTGEYIFKGLYENTIGRITEWLSWTGPVAEDEYAQRVAEEYGAFLHTIPWYEFPFWQKLTGLWRETELWGKHPLRKWERKLALTAEYSIKSAYGAIIKKATKEIYGDIDLTIVLATKNLSSAASQQDQPIEVVYRGSSEIDLIRLPRYEEFTQSVTDLARQNVQILEIAGNNDIFMTVIAPANTDLPASSDILFRLPLPIQPTHERIGISVPVNSLHVTIQELEKSGGRIEHLYDY